MGKRQGNKKRVVYKRGGSMYSYEHIPYNKSATNFVFKKMSNLFFHVFPLYSFGTMRKTMGITRENEK
jgi:hypothetical protein